MTHGGARLRPESTHVIDISHVEAKGAADAVTRPDKGGKTPKVVDLMAALRESLNRIETQKKRPAKAGLRPAAKRRRAS